MTKALARKRAYHERRSYTPEFRAQAVALCLQGTQTMSAIARDLNLSPGLLHNWVRFHRGDPHPSSKGPQGTPLALLAEQLKPESLAKFHAGKPKKVKETTAIVVAPRQEQALAQMPLPILEESDTEPCQRLKRVAVRSGLSMAELVNSLMELAMVEGVRRR